MWEVGVIEFFTFVLLVIVIIVVLFAFGLKLKEMDAKSLEKYFKPRN